VDLTVLCMQQNGAAISAGIINRVIAGFENRGALRTGPVAGAAMTFKLIRRCGDMGCSLELTSGSTTELSATDAWHMTFVGDSDSLRPFDVGCLYRIALCCRRANRTPSFRPVGQAEADGLPSRCTGVRQDRVLSRRELDILLTWHGICSETLFFLL
jgi:hypothetical protein